MLTTKRIKHSNIKKRKNMLGNKMVKSKTDFCQF